MHEAGRSEPIWQMSRLYGERSATSWGSTSGRRHPPETSLGREVGSAAIPGHCSLRFRGVCRVTEALSSACLSVNEDAGMDHAYPALHFRALRRDRVRRGRWAIGRQTQRIAGGCRTNYPGQVARRRRTNSRHGREPGSSDACRIGARRRTCPERIGSEPVAGLHSSARSSSRSFSWSNPNNESRKAGRRAASMRVPPGGRRIGLIDG
jgi:hypothetical protein